MDLCDHQRSEHLFLVGTEEGRVHKCSKAYSGNYLLTYSGHHMVVNSVKWNRFHPNVFLSCSADWTVKLWDHNSAEALLTFDLGEAVGDVAWSPWSSTVFAAVTSDGKVHVFDLRVNKSEPLCEQKVVKRSKLTKVDLVGGAPAAADGWRHSMAVQHRAGKRLRSPAERLSVCRCNSTSMTLCCWSVMNADPSSR